MAMINVLLLASIFLFTIGVTITVVKKNAVMILIGIELMLNAANLNLVLFNRVHPQSSNGEMTALFIIVIAVCETAVGLAIFLNAYQYYRTSTVDEMRDLKG